MLWFVNHEWRKHGTCGKETPDSYFEQICALSAPIVAKVNELRAALSRVEKGDHPEPAHQAPAPLQTPAAAEHSVSEAFSRRQAARSRPYSEGKSRVPRRDEESVPRKANSGGRS